MEKQDAITEAKKLAIKLDIPACYACRYQTTGWTFFENKPNFRPLEVLEVDQRGIVNLA